jgi:hypothetical protein
MGTFVERNSGTIEEAIVKRSYAFIVKLYNVRTEMKLKQDEIPFYLLFPSLRLYFFYVKGSIRSSLNLMYSLISTVHSSGGPN